MSVLRNDSTMVAFHLDRKFVDERIMKVIEMLSEVNDKEMRVYGVQQLLRKQDKAMFMLTKQFFMGWLSLGGGDAVDMPNYQEFMKFCCLCAMAMWVNDLHSAILLYARFDALSYLALEELEENLTGDNPLECARVVLNRDGDKVSEECGERKVANEQAYLDAVNGLAKMKKDFKTYINTDHFLKEVVAKGMGCFEIKSKRVWKCEMYKDITSRYEPFKFHFNRQYTKCSYADDLTEEQIQEIISSTPPAKKKRKGKRGGKKKKRGGRGRKKKSQ